MTVEDGRETEQELRAVQLEGKNMDSVRCMCVYKCGRGRVRWKGQEKIWGTRTVSGVCRGAEATHECLRQPLTRAQMRHTHSTLSIIHI